MACAVAAVPAIASILEPSGDFPAWLETQGVNAEVARAMDSELGIRDYGVLRACVGDGLVRAELLATARDRLPFGFYAVLRQVVKALQGADTHDGGTVTRWDATTASSPGDVTLGSLVDVLLALFSGLSRELLLSMRRLGGGGDDGGDCGDGSGNGGDRGVFSSTDSPPDPEGLTPDYRVANEEEGTASVKDEYSGYDATAVFANAEHRSPTQMDDYGEHYYNHLSAEARQTPTTAVDGSSSNGVAHNIKLETFEGDESRAAPGGEGSNRLRWEEMGAHHSETAGIAANSSFHLAGKLLDKPSLGHVNQDGRTRAESLVPHSNQYDHQWRQQPEPQHHMIGDGDVTTDCAAAGTAASPRLPASWRAAVITAAARRRSREPGGGTIGGVGGGRSVGRRFECTQCGRRFTRSEALVFHMRTHTGERPYCCDVCGRAFSLHSNLKVHQRTHTGERPHRCDVCGRGFTHRSSWKRHQRMHDRIYVMQQLPTTAPATMQTVAQRQHERDGAIERRPCD